MDIDPEQPEAESLGVDEPPGADAQEFDDEAATGELYGVHVPPAVDTELTAPEDQDGFADSTLGENWIEMLEAKAAESGAVPEHELDIIDDSDPERPHHATESGDRPVADKGSGGPGGL